MRRLRLLPTLALLALGTLAAVRPAGAQRVPDRSATLGGGVMSFDASGTGSATVVSLSAAQTLLPSRWLAVEGTLAYAALGEQFRDAPTRFGVAEAQLQLQWPGARLRPYLGAGPGVAHYFTNGGGRDALQPALSAGVGLRAALGGPWGLRLDARLRGWGFGNMSGDATAGLSRPF